MAWDANGRMHIVIGLLNKSTYGPHPSFVATDIVYAYSDDGGKTVHKSDGTPIQFPISATDGAATQGEIVLREDSDPNYQWLNPWPSIAVDKAGQPLIKSASYATGNHLFRREAGQWVEYTKFNYLFDFSTDPSGVIIGKTVDSFIRFWNPTGNNFAKLTLPDAADKYDHEYYRDAGDLVWSSLKGSTTAGTWSIYRTVFSQTNPSQDYPCYYSGASATKTWNTTSAVWGTASGGPYTTKWTAGKDACFEGTAATVTGTAASVHSITFNVTGYKLSTTTVTLTGTGNAIGGTGTGTISGVIADGGQGFTKTTGSTLVLSGANTFSGGVTLDEGTLKLGNDSALGSGTFTINDDTTLQVATSGSYTNFANSQNNPITIDGSFTVNAGTGAFGAENIDLGTGNVTLTTTPTITFYANSVSWGHKLTFGGVIDDGGNGYGLTLLDSAVGNRGCYLVLGAANTYKGDTTVSCLAKDPYRAVIQIGDANSIPNASVNAAYTGNLVVNGGGVFDLSGISANINGLNGTLRGTTNGWVQNSGGAATLTLGYNDATASFAGVISGANLSLTKTGAGTQTLSGTNNYAGNTTVSNGTLVLKVASLATNSTVTVAARAVLQLDFATTNVVAGFVTNGVSVPPGVYKAANAAPFIAGSGSLKVVSVALPRPTIASVTLVGTNLAVTVATVAGGNYVLQSTTNLTPIINWQNEATNSGTGGNLIFNVPIPPAQTRKFLRFWTY